MLAEREEYIKRITQLCLPIKQEGGKEMNMITNDDVKQSTLFIETAAKLASTERVVLELRARIEETRQKWAVARGDADLALKSLRELEETSSRRLIELSGVEFSENCGESAGPSSESGVEGSASLSESVSRAQQIVQLEHKLKQALENVRQAEFVRQSLAEALQMNESLQFKLDDLKAKYAALLASRNPAGRASTETLPSTSSSTPANPSTPKEKLPAPAESATAATSQPLQPQQPTERIDKNDKLHRDYRRLRKELDATRASKEAAKAKLEVRVYASCMFFFYLRYLANFL
jgi:regulator of replication initiation timing